MNTVQIDPQRLAQVKHLDKGAHQAGGNQMCLLEAVAFVSGEAWSDKPSCASPILGSFGRSLNDVLPEEKRQRLVPLIPAIVGTAGDGLDQRRGLMAADWIARTYTPTWLRLAGLTSDAQALEAAPEVTSWDELVAVTPFLVKGQQSAAAAWAAARDAAWAAARDAAQAAAQAAAWAAARDAAWDAARDAAQAAAWDAAQDAAQAAAWAAARDAAQAAAWDAARDAAQAAAWDAAWDAAREVLRPTTETLQDSAIELFERMVTIGRSA